jgi:hypothetical protein
MDSETLEALLVFGKTAVIIGGGCAVTLGSLWGLCAAAINYFQRKDRRDELLPLYEQGTITTKPTIVNVYRIAGHNTAVSTHQPTGIAG